MKELLELYRTWKGAEAVNVEKLAGAGSNREYYRLTDDTGSAVIGVIGTSRDENHAFVYLAKHFEKRQLPVPHVLAVTADETCYLQSDLGTVSLFDAIRGGREAGGRFIDALKLFYRLVNIGDAKSLATHPATTTHRQLSSEELKKAGVGEDMVRLSIGLEHIDDLLEDLEQALMAAV